MVFLASLQVRKNQIFLISEDDVLTEDVHQNFFCDELGGKFDSKNTYIFESSDPDLLDAIKDYCIWLKVKLISDAGAQEVEKELEKRTEDFEKLKKYAIKVKNQKQSTIKIPYLKKGIKLKSYQNSCVNHANSLEASANFSVPGSGKTWMGYASYFLEKSKKNVNKLLVVGPNSSFKPWEHEYFEMTGEEPNVARITGKQEDRIAILNSSEFFEIFLVNYFIISKEFQRIKRMLSEDKFMIIVDESHHIKNPNSQAASALLELANSAKKRMILSGTPVPNNFDDLWSQFSFLYPNFQVFGGLLDYQFNLKNYEGFPAEQLAFVKEQIEPFYTRISKKDLQLPPTKIKRIPIPMGKTQERIYNAIRGHIKDNEKISRVDEIGTQKWKRAAMIYLLECATDPSLLSKSSQYDEKPIVEEGLPIQEAIKEYPNLEVPNKLKVLSNLVKEIISRKDPQTKQNSKVIVWCSFVNSIKKLEEMLEEYNPICISGAVPKDEEDDPHDNREIRIENFKTESDCNLLIANPASLAESISLHKSCHDAIYLDRTYNGGHYMQSLERIHRIGIPPRTKTRYYILQSKNSIDLNIDSRLEDKKDRMLEILNDIDPSKLDYDLTFDQFTNDDEFDSDFGDFMNHVNKD